MRQLLEDYIRPISTAVFERIGAARDGHVLTPRGLHVTYNTAKDVGYRAAGGGHQVGRREALAAGRSAPWPRSRGRCACSTPANASRRRPPRRCNGCNGCNGGVGPLAAAEPPSRTPRPPACLLRWLRTDPAHACAPPPGRRLPRRRTARRGARGATAAGGSFNSGRRTSSPNACASRRDSAARRLSRSAPRSDSEHSRQNTALRSAIGGKRHGRLHDQHHGTNERSSDSMMSGVCGRGGLGNHEEMDMQNTATVGASLM